MSSLPLSYGSRQHRRCTSCRGRPATDTAVLQGNSQFDGAQNCVSGCSTHDDDAMRFAWDFALPEGTEVVAARGGTVALAERELAARSLWRGLGHERRPGIASPFIGNEANFVEIDHGDGTSGAVSAPEPGRSGDRTQGEDRGTGARRANCWGCPGRPASPSAFRTCTSRWRTVFRADWFTTSVPISFADRDVVSRNPQGIPVEGESYVSENSAPSPDSP